MLAVARVAGILAAKRTPDLIPLCHPIPLTDIQIEVTADHALPGIIAEATARATWKTGVEMEALDCGNGLPSHGLRHGEELSTVEWNSTIYRWYKSQVASWAIGQGVDGIVGCARIVES